MIKYVQLWKHVTAMKKHVLIKHIFPGGKYNKSKSIFDRIEEFYNDLIKKERLIYYIIILFLLSLMKTINIIPMSVHLILKLC